MSHSRYPQRRKSHMDLHKVYFWTATIRHWKPLLNDDRYKDVVISSLHHLSTRNLIDVYAFIIMPNHLHMIWRMNQLNGTELPYASFMKFTGQAFRKLLLVEQPDVLPDFVAGLANKQHEFWQRDSLAIELYTMKVALQKLHYLHWNPLAEHWRLVNDPGDYKYSSFRYYEYGLKDFDFLKDLWEVIG